MRCPMPVVGFAATTNPARSVLATRISIRNASLEYAHVASQKQRPVRSWSCRDAIAASRPDDIVIAMSSPAFLREGSPRGVLEATLVRLRADESAVLALVLETEGSTYARAGDVVLFSGDVQAGWLSGGCLESEVARRAKDVDTAGRIGWMEIDTRGDEALFSGSALGCRGRMRIILLPLRAMPGVEHVLDAWLQGGVALERHVHASGEIVFRAGSLSAQWHLPTTTPAWPPTNASWQLPLARLPRVLALGAGPETPTLVSSLRSLGWWVCVAERRSRWDEAGGGTADIRVKTMHKIKKVISDQCVAMFSTHAGHPGQLSRPSPDPAPPEAEPA